jgi:small-conductance mechanosensitive channel/CRP-like cAMP-binding protein
MSFLYPWVLTIAALIISLLLNRGCRGLNLPPLPWRLPWILLLLWTLEQSIQKLEIPLATGINFNIANQVIASIAISRVLIWLILELMPRFRILPNSPRILRDTLFILCSGVLVALSLQQHSRIDLVGLVTTSAVLTAVLGLAAQDPLKDLIGGLSLQVEKVIREGDWIEIDNQIGRVESISWRDTELRCRNGSRLVLPHSSVSSSSIRNFTSFGAYGNKLLIGLDYSLPPHQAKAMMRKISNNHPLILDNPKTIIRIHEFEESTIVYEWIIWHKNFSNRFAIRGEIQEQLWYSLSREGLGFPFPVRDVRLQRSLPAGDKIKSRKEQLQAQTINLLEKNELFSSLSQSQLLNIFNSSAVHAYGDGEIIVAEGDSGESLFMLINGQVSIRKYDTATGDISVAELKSGEIFGEMTLFIGSPRSATARSATALEVLEVHRDAIAGLMEQEPVLLERFGQMISRRQAQLQSLRVVQAQTSRRDIIDRMKTLFSNILS